MSDTDHTSEQQVLHGRQHPSLFNHGHVQSLPHARMSSLPHAHMHDINAHSREGHSQAEMKAHGRMNLHYAHSHPHGLLIRDDRSLGDEPEDDPADDGLEEAEVHSDEGHPGDPQSSLIHRTQGTNQLTLSYQGEVYVFDTVPPEKMQAVLLLLGGREVLVGMPGTSLQGHHQLKIAPELPQRLNMPQRLASLTRFREKRKERNFEKKIRYTVRKEVASRMQRKRGQFTSSKAMVEEPSSLSNSENGQSQNNQLKVVPHQEAICGHCGIGEHSTPMMRRGPNGPRTLCNACGLMWANKGVLRELSKTSAHAAKNQPSSPHATLEIQKLKEHHVDAAVGAAG